jgi:hypothetical protein
MHNGNFPTTLRRSSRVPTAQSVLVTSLEGTHFSEVCETLVVNAHGCSMLSPVKLEDGIPLHLHSKEGRETTAHVVYCQPIGADKRRWRLGASLDRPENFWGLRECPDDWTLPDPGAPAKLPQTFSATPTLVPHKPGSQVAPPTDIALGRLAHQLEAPLTRMIAEAVRPLQAEITALKEKIAHREANPSRFEVSLAGIPPQLEQQLEVRLRKDLGPKALEEAREQYAQLLAAARTTIDQRTTEGYEEFLRRAAGELQAVEKRAQAISAHISANAQEDLRLGLEEFHKKLVDGGNSLKRLSEELYDFLQQNLHDEHTARHGELEKLRTSVASESSRLHQHIEYLDGRIAKLDDSTRSLESGLDQRLGQMSSNTVKETRTQLESVANGILEDLTTRGDKTIGTRLDEASENMKLVQKGIIASVSETLKTQAANASETFEHSMDEMAKRSVERWRHKLAGGLNAVLKSLGEQFQSAAGSSPESSPESSPRPSNGPSHRSR